MSEQAVTHVVALSGGKDSTALALALREREPETDFHFLCTPTGNELPEMEAHWARLEALLETPITRLRGLLTLEERMAKYSTLPSTRMRWCTEELKIRPALIYLRANAPAIQYVGLRADEPADTRSGLETDDIACRFPLREWGWRLRDVREYLAYRGVTVPERTDCAWCPFQRLGEWYRLAVDHPDLYARGEEWEARTGHTFRNARRDSKPAGLAELKVFAPEELERERLRHSQGRLDLFDDDEERHHKCRVCSL